jgi:hypothetical protein
MEVIMKLKQIAPLLTMLSFISCGKGHEESVTILTSEVTQEGDFKAILRPYNQSLSGWIPNGMVRLKIAGDQLDITAWLDDSASVTHRINIHQGSECPSSFHDSNRDGLVDFQESIKASKDILIPIDSHLNEQVSENDFYPFGNFSYSERGSLSKILMDLAKDDLDLEDSVIKWPHAKGLNLEGKVIIVSGISPARNLPTTVSSLKEMSPQLSMPIACGVIEKI